MVHMRICMYSHFNNHLIQILKDGLISKVNLSHLEISFDCIFLNSTKNAGVSSPLLRVCFFCSFFRRNQKGHTLFL
jgi:hypothetical protein